MKAQHNKRKALWLSITGVLVVVLFTFNIVPFPIAGGDTEGYGDPCYSPDMAYYIKRYTTLPKALFVTPSHSKSGLAILYDKNENEIYRSTAHDIYKPGWFGDHVSFFGGWGSGGYNGATLPSNVGDDLIGCYSPNLGG